MTENAKTDTKTIGTLGESIAVRFLQKKGFRILERNYRRKWGEIDIIALKDAVVRFIEVKSVSYESLSDISREINGYRPEELVHQYKLHKIARMAEAYMNENDDGRDVQIDVVGVFLDIKKKEARCRLFEQVL